MALLSVLLVFALPSVAHAHIVPMHFYVLAALLALQAALFFPILLGPGTPLEKVVWTCGYALIIALSGFTILLGVLTSLESVDLLSALRIGAYLVLLIGFPLLARRSMKRRAARSNASA